MLLFQDQVPILLTKGGENLGISIIKKGESNKAEAILKMQDSLNLSRDKILFLGDDVNDLTVIPHVNLFFTPKNAHHACKKKANFIGKLNGGEGFVREVADKIFFSHGLNPYKEFKTRNEFSD